MNHIRVIAMHTVRQLLRERILYNLVAFAVLMILSTVLLSRLSVGEAQRIVIDIGLATVNLFGVVISIFIGITLVSRELDRRTVYLILTKPVPRRHLILGKYAGLCVTLFVNWTVMVMGLVTVLFTMKISLGGALIQALSTVYLELAVLTAIAVLFSAVTTTTLSAMFTLALFIIGHGVSTLRSLIEHVGGWAQSVLMTATYVLPNLELFNLKGHVIQNQLITGYAFGHLIAYACAYIACLLWLATLVFERRDLC
jgi:ABC-type transport system involved in multi-copper enzyme maturation permease subunit